LTFIDLHSASLSSIHFSPQFALILSFGIPAVRRHNNAGALERGGLPPLCAPQTVPGPTAGLSLPQSMSTSLILGIDFSKNALYVNGKNEKNNIVAKP
jgi:hypothetical protein